jgi:hypothetical protein
MQYFTYSWHNIFTVHVPSLIAVEFLLFIKSEFTTNAQSVLHPRQCTHGHVLSRTSGHFQKPRGGCKWFDGHQKYLRVASSFEIGTEYAGGF